MVLSEDEERQLSEIESHLGTHDRRLARIFIKTMKMDFPPIVLIYLLAASPLGLCVAALGSNINSPILFTVGIAVWAGLPAVIGWRLVTNKDATG